ncbi:MAG: glutathione S-transferase family protein [Alphaproteobacteria bacterium]|nr:glutathione S-transferase family protein [Alphaproteobacteria bacterium]
MTHDIIFHHYPTSPFSEKVRVVFGMKGMKWRSVEIPNMMPKPDLMPLTGGYRKTPVMQIGADIFCDTQIILREIERRFPDPPIMPNAGLSFAVAFWADRPLFQATVPLIFGEIGPMIPEAFKKDREKLFPERPFNYEQMKAAAPLMKDQWRAHVGFIDAQLQDGRAFLSQAAGVSKPTVTDAHCYMNLWFLKAPLPQLADVLLKEFPRVEAWYERVKALGHGTATAMESKEALRIAKEATSEAKVLADPHDPNGRKPGDSVSVMPDDYGRDPVVGEIVFSNAQEIAIKRHDPLVGDVVVHFPRAGFWVMPA